MRPANPAPSASSDSFVLLFDVGNTAIKLGVAPAAEGPLLAAAYTLPTDNAATADSLGLQLTGLLRHAGVNPAAVEACLASSVAPAMDPLLEQACARHLGLRMRFAPEDVPFPLENRYARPQEVGADRLLAAYAATRLHPAPAHIVIDFGTATTFDCVAGEAYLGGLICPGVLSSTRALASQTAKLPQVRLQALTETDPAPRIGVSTSQSLTHGALFGFAAMVDGLADRLAPLVAREASSASPEAVLVVATGGVAQAITRVTKRVDTVSPDLLLTGLKTLYDESRR